MTLRSINPATGETLAQFELLGDEALERKLALAEQAAQRWRKFPLGERAAMLRRAADQCSKRRDELGRIATLEMGKLFSASLAEVDKCAACLRWYADNAER